DVRRLDVQGGRSARRELAQDSVQAARVRGEGRAGQGSGAGGRRMTTLVEVDRLAKTFRQGFWMRRVEAVRGGSVSVCGGEIFGFLGPNGAGKTTTIKMLTGLIAPTGGRATVFGRQVPSPEAMKGVGFLPENPYVYPYLTPREFVELCGRLSGLSGAAAR